MSQIVCKFGWKCHRPDCYFLHPNGRETDGAPATGAAVPASVRPPPSPSNSSGAPRAASNVPNACRFDRACNRADCYFAHPNGRVIDEQSDQDQDYDADLKEFNDAGDEADFNQYLADNGMLQAQDEDSWFPACQSCECCKGWIYKCPCAAQYCLKCSARQYAADVSESTESSSSKDPTESKVPESWAPWKDEWFPASRDCKKCNGFKYRVAGFDVCPDCKA